jgi:hypothetical protein
MLLIAGDWNDYYDGYMPLRNPTSFQHISREYGQIHNGLKILMYAVSYTKEKKLRIDIFPGNLKEEEDEWRIYINEDNVVSLKDSDFKDYSIEEILGKKYIDGVRTRNPEHLEDHEAK